MSVPKPLLHPQDIAAMSSGLILDCYLDSFSEKSIRFLRDHVWGDEHRANLLVGLHLRLARLEEKVDQLLLSCQK